MLRTQRSTTIIGHDGLVNVFVRCRAGHVATITVLILMRGSVAYGNSDMTYINMAAPLYDPGESKRR